MRDYVAKGSKLGVYSIDGINLEDLIVVKSIYGSARMSGNRKPVMVFNTKTRKREKIEPSLVWGMEAHRLGWSYSEVKEMILAVGTIVEDEGMPPMFKATNSYGEEIQGYNAYLPSEEEEG